MSSPWARARRRVASVVVPLTVVACFVDAAPAAADSAIYADTVGDFWDATGDATAKAAGDILGYAVHLDAVWGLEVYATTAATAANPLPALVQGGGDTNYAQIDIDTTGDWQPEYIANTTVDGGWYVGSTSGSSSGCRVPQILEGPDTFGIEVPPECIGSPAHVGIRVLLFIDGGSDFAPDGLAPVLPGVSSGPDTGPIGVPRVPVFRFWSPTYGNAHFFTADSREASNLYSYGYLAWRFEGIAFSALPADGAACDDGSAMYRFWSPVFSSHFYTLNADERDHIVAADHNWQYEGVAYCAFSDQQMGTVPLYRFWSPKFGKHFFTANQAEADHIRAVDRNWQYEGIAAYVIPEA